MIGNIDDFGCAAALRAALAAFEAGCRRTGRTARLVDRVSDGDVVYCATRPVARHLEERLREVGKPGVRVLLCEPGTVQALAVLRHGGVYFESDWVIGFFEVAIDRAARAMAAAADISRGDKFASGPVEPLTIVDRGSLYDWAYGPEKTGGRE
ncbi:hypothetical protein [Oricola thermophila]|uniref:Uncharacterized protein n=1 Tax=Oricola thermophila TaxID=2742145 RepID=A0A6N1VM06_9HYPH|nr:hypothetical protein [Oricola thermophila]QKV20259.1 hypothetical protein HTY61_18270 [Oricola thermophila]